MEEIRELKMWLAVRTDIKISLGKFAAQAGHGFQWATIDAQAKCPETVAAYLKTGTPKITVRADSEAMLKRVRDEAEKAGIPFGYVEDEGRTELPPGTPTVCGFGPCYRDELPAFLKRLRTWKDD